MITRRTVLGATPAAVAASTARAEDGAVMQCLALLDAQAHLRTGSPGDTAVAGHVRATLSDAGFRVMTRNVEAPAFETRRAALEWPGGEVAVEPQPIVRATGAEGVRGPLRLWRDASDSESMTGAIALVLLPHGRHSQLMAEPIRSILAQVARAGPRGIVLITNGPTGESILLNTPIDGAGLPPLPLAVLGPAPGANAIAAARAGVEATLIIDGQARRVRSPNMWGVIERDARFIVVSTPRTAWTPAVAERGPGLAAFTALARWAPRALSAYSLMFVSTTAHEYDNAGAHVFFERHAPPPERVALWLHLGAGFAARDFHEVGRFALAPLPSPDPQRYLMGSDALVPILRESFAGQPGLEAAYPTSAGAAGELGEVVQRGYAPAFGLFAAHRFHHVAQDRLDKTDPAWIDAAIQALKRTLTRVLA